MDGLSWYNQLLGHYLPGTSLECHWVWVCPWTLESLQSSSDFRPDKILVLETTQASVNSLDEPKIIALSCAAQKYEWSTVTWLQVDPVLTLDPGRKAKGQKGPLPPWRNLSPWPPTSAGPTSALLKAVKEMCHPELSLQRFQTVFHIRHTPEFPVQVVLRHCPSLWGPLG